MLFNLTIRPEATYHIKMIILDGVSNYWAGLDSGVFIKNISTDNNTSINFNWGEPEYDDVGTTIYFNNISSTNLNSTYFWDFNNDGDIDSNEINPSYTFEEPGDYIISLDVINNCTGLVNSISYEINIPSIALNDLISENLSIYPNPTHDKLYISFPDSFVQSSIEIIDFSGRVIKEISIYSEAIDISNFNKGIYYVNIKDEFNKSIYFEKLIVL
jgi:PKD repeat protein